MQYGNEDDGLEVSGIDRRFKSYYVVWKLLRKMKNNIISGGLNRTMQYGNKEFAHSNSFKI